jgi:hypothetical protein
MKRFHVHVRVSALEQSIDFYSTLFGVPPAVLKADYAKWMLDDPRVNFAISTHAANAGLDHLSACRLNPMRISQPSLDASPQQAMPSLRRRVLRAVTRLAIRSGSLISAEFPGIRFSPSGIARFMVRTQSQAKS